jgi:hypothetical protein
VTSASDSNADCHKKGDYVEAQRYKIVGKTMPTDKAERIYMRVRPDPKRLFRETTECENRSQTNLLQTLILDHCRKLGLVATPRENRTESEG